MLNKVAHVILIRFVLADAQVQRSLALPRQRRPVAAHCLEPLVDRLFAAVKLSDQPGVALLAALFEATDGWHQEAPIMRLELQFERAVKMELLTQMLLEPLIDMGHRRRCSAILRSNWTH